MAWPLSTRVTDELITPTIWNADIVANLNAIMRPIARKTSDQSVTSSTAFVDDSTLQLTVGVNEVWLFQFHLRYDGSSTGDIKISFSLPASGQIDASAWPPSNTTGIYQDLAWQALTTSDSQPASFLCIASGTARPLIIQGTYIGAGTAGSVKLRWAQNTSDATATKVLTHSTLWAAKLV